ncbi:MAG TPA: histidinol dehydrogenase [Rhodothermales bacterium]|nr:histidinol dehydrogenase [Rhodothermales bacterium]
MLSVFRLADADDRLAAILAREATFSPEVDAAVAAILDDVRVRGDAALADLTERFDGVRPAALRVPEAALDAALGAMDPALRAVIEEAHARVTRYHEAQRERGWWIEDEGGTLLGQRVVPMARVGLYVPGGTAFYPSSLVMNAVPARVAGVGEVHVVSPPQRETGRPHPLVLGTARLLGLTHVYAVGGAQAVGALAFGTETVPRVDKIVGPGNAYVASAKRQVFGRVAIDSIAGPSEIVVLADDAANPTYAAADLLSQAEHDVRASALLVTPSARLAESVAAEVARLAETLPRRDIVAASLRDYGAALVTATMDEAIDVVNRLAPEHLELLVAEPWTLLPRILHTGAVFLGAHSPEPIGDYFAGPNHVLPTGGTARYASALGVYDFVRRQSVIAYGADALTRDAAKVARFARAEGLEAHALAVEVRQRTPSSS